MHTFNPGIPEAEAGSEFKASLVHVESSRSARAMWGDLVSKAEEYILFYTYIIYVIYNTFFIYVILYFMHIYILLLYAHILFYTYMHLEYVYKVIRSQV